MTPVPPLVTPVPALVTQVPALVTQVPPLVTQVVTAVPLLVTLVPLLVTSLPMLLMHTQDEHIEYQQFLLIVTALSLHIVSVSTVAAYCFCVIFAYCL